MNTKECRRSREWILVYDDTAATYEEVNDKLDRSQSFSYFVPQDSHNQAGLASLPNPNIPAFKPLVALSYHKKNYKYFCAVPIVSLLVFVASFQFGSQPQSLQCVPGPLFSL